MDKELYDFCVKTLEKELVPALGCTEPIAIAYASALARHVLGVMPESVEIGVSGNIIKNVKSVVVPNTNGLKGIDTACIVGVVAGDYKEKLQVLKNIKSKDVEKTVELIESKFCKITHLQSNAPLHLIVTAKSGDENSLVELKNGHTNIVRVERNGEVIFDEKEVVVMNEPVNFKIKDIYEFAMQVNIDDVREVLSRQIQCNTAIAKEGMTNDYGQRVGKSILKLGGDNVFTRAKAYAAAGSDARMNGCALAVVINSGSGNQGMTVSLPVIEYAKELKVSEDTLYRGLVISNLIAIYLKRGIGKLSAYCGVVSASCGAGAGITYLHGGSFDVISKTITNTIANVSGIVCDGAKASCAAKIASSVDACILGHTMAMDNDVFISGDGIVKGSLERTIEGVSRIGKDAMKETDKEILDIMLEDYE